MYCTNRQLEGVLIEHELQPVTSYTNEKLNWALTTTERVSSCCYIGSNSMSSNNIHQQTPAASDSTIQDRISDQSEPSSQTNQ